LSALSALQVSATSLNLGHPGEIRGGFFLFAGKCVQALLCCDRQGSAACLFDEQKQKLSDHRGDIADVG
jgi:hypothetical protein